MGLSNKLATKIRTKDQVGTVAIGGDWVTYGSFVAASIIRGAACALAGTNVNSTTYRGSDFLGINATKNLRASTIWVEQNGLNQWFIAVGAPKISYGRAYDWQLQFDVVEGPTGRTLNVSTPAQSTKDGTLMNKHQFMETRELVLTGMALGKAPHLASEEAVTKASRSYTAWPLIGLKEGAERRDQTIRTVLSAQEIDEKLNCLPCRVLERTSRERTVKVGAASQRGDRTMTISTFEHDDFREVRIFFDIELNGPVAVDIINVKHAFILSTLALELLKSADPTAHVTGDAPGTDEVDG